MKNKNIVCYIICSIRSNSMLSKNPNSGIYMTETAGTITTSGGNPTTNQGGLLICQKRKK